MNKMFKIRKLFLIFFVCTFFLLFFHQTLQIASKNNWESDARTRCVMIETIWSFSDEKTICIKKLVGGKIQLRKLVCTSISTIALMRFVPVKFNWKTLHNLMCSADGKRMAKLCKSGLKTPKQHVPQTKNNWGIVRWKVACIIMERGKKGFLIYYRRDAIVYYHLKLPRSQTGKQKSTPVNNWEDKAWKWCLTVMLCLLQSIFHWNLWKCRANDGRKKGCFLLHLSERLLKSCDL